MEAVQAIFDSVDVKHNKVVLFANFNASVEILAKTFSKLQPAVVYGPNGPERNMVQVRRFRTDKDCRVLIANPQAGGVGLTLGDISQTVVFVEPVSTPGAFDQAAARVILSGQTEPVVVYIFRVNQTLSKRATEVMLGRAAQANEVNMDAKSMLDELLGVV
jgi:SNF2 family DNA or RNA helicase